jgi:hypothetical protein
LLHYFVENLNLSKHLTYMRASHFGQKIDYKLTIRLIRGSTYTRVYTVDYFGKRFPSF